MTRGLISVLLLLLFFLNGCGSEVEKTPPPPKEEPKGTPVSLADKDLPHPKEREELKTSSRWGTKGDKLRLKGAHDKALFCFHKCQETFPTDFAEGYDGRRVPLLAYVRKSYLYSFMGEEELADYYLRLAKGAENPPRFAVSLILAAELQLVYIRGDYQGVLDRLPDEPQEPYDRIFASACKLKMGDKTAHDSLKKAWADYKASGKGLYNVIPPEIRELVNTAPQ